MNKKKQLEILEALAALATPAKTGSETVSIERVFSPETGRTTVIVRELVYG